jgi:hypothetical protein
METLVAEADKAGEASQNILTEAVQIGTEASTLHTEIEHFLNAVKDDAGDSHQGNARDVATA